MKKKLIIFALGIILIMPGCFNKDNNEGYEENVMDTPEYSPDTKDSDEAQNNIPDNVIDGYELIELSKGYKVYIPYIKESERVQGVSYCLDQFKYNNIGGIYTYNTTYNKPDGTNSVKLKASGFAFEYAAQPSFSEIYNVEDNLNKLNYYTDAYRIYGEGNRTEIEEKNFAKCDIEAISVALYEEFYDNRPSLAVNIYGISTTKWKNEFSADNKFSSEQYWNYTESLKNEGMSSCELMATKKIDKTGVYYIDISELEKKGDYQQFIIEFKFDKEMEYSFCLNEGGTYSIDNEEKYIKWKADKRNYFIN